MRLIDEQYLRTPFYGSRRMTVWLSQQGRLVNRKRVQRLMRLMGIEAIYPRPRTTQRNAEHRVFPYLLRGVADRAAQPGVVHRHHLRAAAVRVHVPDGGDRLVQPLRAVVAAVEQPGGRLLRGSVGGGLAARQARDLQHRSGIAVHGRGLHGTAGAAPAWRSAWTVAAAPWTTCSSSGCGEP